MPRYIVTNKSGAAFSSNENEEEKKRRPVFVITGRSKLKTNTFYSPTQRFAMMINTTKSIRKMVPDSFIVLSDYSSIEYSQEEKEAIFPLVDISVEHSSEFATMEMNQKQFGDAYAFLQGLLLFINAKTPPTNPLFVAKLSGRYWLTPNFRKWNLDDPSDLKLLTNHLHAKVGGPGHHFYETTFYYAGWKVLDLLYDLVYDCHNLMHTEFSPGNIENSFYQMVKNHNPSKYLEVVSDHDVIGVAGWRDYERPDNLVDH